MGIKEMGLSRRWFILGSTAAIASAKLSLAGTPALFAPLDVPKRVDIRLIRKIELFNGDVGPIYYSFYRNGNGPKMFPSFGVGRGGRLFWWAAPGEEIYLIGHDTLRILGEPDPGNEASMDIGWDAADGVPMWTNYHFRNGVATPIATEPVYASAGGAR